MSININNIMTSLDLSTISSFSSVSTRRTKLNNYERTNGYSFSSSIRNFVLRDKVIIPDKEGDGDRIALQAIELGWSVTFPEFGKCKDVNDAIVKYGKIYVINQIMTNISSGNDAILRLKLYCT